MSDFEKAIAVVLKHEGGFFHNKTTGEIVNFGITLDLLKAKGFDHADEAYVKALTVDRAKALYEQFFWRGLHIDKIENQKLATAVLDMTVNMGPIAIKLFQNALNDNRGFEPMLTPDGILGPKSLEYANKLPVEGVLHELVELACARYAMIASRSPVLASNLNGWTSRARSLA